MQSIVADEVAQDDLIVRHMSGNMLDPHLVERLRNQGNRIEHAEIDDRPLAKLARAGGNTAILPQRDILTGGVARGMLFQGQAPVVWQDPKGIVGQYRLARRQLQIPAFALNGRNVVAGQN